MLLKHPLARYGFTPANDEFFHAVPEDAVRPNLSPLMRRAFCSHGSGIRHQISTCGLWLAGKEGEPAGGKKEDLFPEELIGQFIKDTVMHEVGHTLGLRHNFKASAYRASEEIFVENPPGDIAASVMDYLPIAIAPEGKLQSTYAMTTIGPYDLWAIEYGYTTNEKDATPPTRRTFPGSSRAWPRRASTMPPTRTPGPTIRWSTPGTSAPTRCSTPANGSRS
jgi:hypothetical protein